MIKMLDLVGFQDDKEEYATKFVDICSANTFSGLINQLPPAEKELLLKNLNKIKSIEEKIKFTKNYFGQEKIDLKFNLIARELIADYLTNIKKNLDDKQISSVKKYLLSEF